MADTLTLKTLKPTEVIVMDGAQVVGRIWEGESSAGVKVECLINQIRVRSDRPQEEFESQLLSLGAKPIPIQADEWVHLKNQRVT